jgi:lambda family phage minor tail protein L
MTYSSSDFSGGDFDAVLAKQDAFDKAERKVRSTFYDTVVELFEFDLSPLNTSGTNVVSGTLNYYFANFVVPTELGTQEGGNFPIWRTSETSSIERVYQPVPILASGYERTSKGQIPQPEITVSNVFGLLSGLINSLDDLVGVRVLRRRTLAKYLGNFDTKDFDTYFPTDIFYIERKVSENNISVTFQLASPFDVEGLMIPRRIVTHNHCLWTYRGRECGYGGALRASDLNGMPVANALDRVPASGDAFYDSASLNIRNYFNALEAWRTASITARNAEAVFNVARGKQQIKCDLEESVKTRKYDFDREDDDDGTYELVSSPTFALVLNSDGGTDVTICVVWEGNDVTDQPEKYRANNSKVGSQDGRSAESKIRNVQLYKFSSNWDGSSGSAPQINLQHDNLDVAFHPQSQSTGNVFAFENGNFFLRDIDPDFKADDEDDEIFDRVDSLDYINNIGLREVEEIDEGDVAGCTAATTELAAATTALENANTAFNTARGTLNARYSSLTVSEIDTLVQQFDVCGKRLTSCQLRFGEQNLPYGGFPGSNLAR